MHYFAPERPRLPNGLPQYLDASGRPIAALQSPVVSPKPDGSFEIWVFLKRGGKNNFQNFSCRVPELPGLLAFFEAYLADPEEVFATRFSYSAPAPEAPKASGGLTLEDLL